LRLYAFPKPFVVACTGHAMAAGALILLAADARFGAAGAFKIGLNEVAIGMPLPVLAQELARDRLDPRQLTAATLQATVYEPQAAASAGYLDEIVEAEQVVEAATRRAAQLGQYSAAAYAATKGRLRGGTIAHIRQTLEADLESLTGPAAG
jgi:enoyl-CoA hydratase